MISNEQAQKIAAILGWKVFQDPETSVHLQAFAYKERPGKTHWISDNHDGPDRNESMLMEIVRIEAHSENLDAEIQRRLTRHLRPATTSMITT